MTVAAFVFMIIDSRRIGVRRVWIYMALCLLMATSVSLPLYLIARERATNSGDN